MVASNTAHFLPFLFAVVLALWMNGSSAKAQSLVLPCQNDVIFRSSDGSSCPSPDPLLYYQPVIGILSHPGDGASGRLTNATNASNIPASYVKFVESVGARVIPIIYNEPEDIIIKKLNVVNGVFFTGGWAKTGLYYDVSKKIFEIVLAKNDAGDHFPLYGMALGFELLTMFISQDNDILEKIDIKNQASTLQFSTSDFNGTLFQSFPPDLLAKMSTECLAMHNSMYGISPTRLQADNALSSFFNILTTSADTNNVDFVSTAQAYNYPIVGFQWIPSRNAFEWGYNYTIPHTEDAIRVTQQTANYFISEARKSSTRPKPIAVLTHLIYNFQPTYSGYAGKGYDQVYIFVI
ncbi:gamma-glutamyl hydrolase 2-like [Dioscorea cayenensis subsp. rotundata]|uniref:folate gamma-glutamyl hydrolase n=1 Tax=Dioscorea cayennensis subsp. rotundata TaxID=55577 RepID=A0AB40CHD9_DIOCR|nr:gamma-glutamyl hydrolase 2-like [Dioscorea cayenensis subsp. rotundata]